jgi:tetratricopeptide (TPR) repeat protein
MRLRATSLLTVLAFAAFVGAGSACAAESADAPAPPAAKEAAPAPQTPAEMRADLYRRLAESKDSDETEGLVGLLLESYALSGSDTGDLLLRRAHKAIGQREFDAAENILDATVTLLPDWAEGWNARATLRYLDDDFDGSMADIAETLKREPRHLGALLGMAKILQARDKSEDALKVYERVLAIAPRWENAQKAVEKLKADIAGQEL